MREGTGRMMGRGKEGKMGREREKRVEGKGSKEERYMEWDERYESGERYIRKDKVR